MTVIGNGLLSREFNKNAISDECVIIAAGVSNSKETKAEEFNREELLVKDILLKFKEKKVVYFSTCSILQLEATPYIKHKIKMEEIIRESAVQYFIFRLPQVVGVVNNNTLVSYLVRNAYLNNPLNIQENAFRNLLDVEDVGRLIRKVIDCNISHKGIALNIASSPYIRVLDIAEKIKSILRSESRIKVIPGGEKYNINISHIKRYVGEKDIIFSEKYCMYVIEKYTHKIISEFSNQWNKYDLFGE